MLRRKKEEDRIPNENLYQVGHKKSYSSEGKYETELEILAFLLPRDNIRNVLKSK